MTVSLRKHNIVFTYILYTDNRGKSIESLLRSIQNLSKKLNEQLEFQVMNVCVSEDDHPVSEVSLPANQSTLSDTIDYADLPDWKEELRTRKKTFIHYVR